MIWGLYGDWSDICSEYHIGAANFAPGEFIMILNVSVCPIRPAQNWQND